MNSKKNQNKKERNITAENNIKQVRESIGIKDWQNACGLILEEWQYVEPINLDEKDRFKSDEEAYKEAFYNIAYPLYNYDRSMLLKRLIGNIEESKTKNEVWLKYKQYLKEELETETSTPHQIEEKQEPPAEHLKDLFKDEKDLFKDKSLYDKVIDILIGENYIEKGTLIWKDETNGRNKFVAGLIKDLYNKGYLSRRAKNKEIPLISKNTFNVDLSQSIAEKTIINDNDTIYKFIPIVTELQ
ncbi:hypothetical protein CW751_09725 [Brumimicrobium salinarum]|uniref:Uncharacterized protein n=1 Tax=Brumimicrobium salinarum TaxID=2058658 RepID=A0A2I0R222_9FLAO|nr:hypothetical protein [Brumimicrobium salinarum]PKR80638.1 hypothetical protein CW751_09725 [Brumimicrobium salinarum]